MHPPRKGLNACSFSGNQTKFVFYAILSWILTTQTTFLPTHMVESRIKFQICCFLSNFFANLQCRNLVCHDFSRINPPKYSLLSWMSLFFLAFYVKIAPKSRIKRAFSTILSETAEYSHKAATTEPLFSGQTLQDNL